MKKIPLHWQILIALVLSVFFGASFPNAVPYISWMGIVFMRLIKMVIIPLVLFSLISGTANLGSSKNLGRLGIKTISYYFITSLLAIITGLFFVNLIRPGVGADLGFAEKVTSLTAQQKPIQQTLIEIIPDNIFVAFTKGEMLSVIFFSMLFGLFITRIGSKPRELLTDFFNAGFDVMMKITMFIIRFTPFGIFGIVAKVVSEQSDLLELGKRLGLYMLVVLAGLTVHAVITLPLMMKFIGKVNPVKHFKAVSSPLLMAFSTSSSGATLPLTLNAVENNCGVPNKISSFTIPLGATINMDGTALYECVAAMFIAQAYGIEMSVGSQFIIVFTALLASIGAAAIPMAGFFMMTIILTAVGLPVEGLGLILAVDRILDMFRTCVNTWSDTCCTVVIAKSEGETLKV